MENIKTAIAEILSDFNSLPGILGVFVSNGRDIHASLTHSFDTEKLAGINRTLLEAFTDSRKEGFESKKITFTYNNGLLVSRIFNESEFLNVFCDREVTSTSLDLLIDLVINKINKELEKNRDKKKRAVEESKVLKEKKIPAQSLDEIMNGPLKLIFNDINNTLCDNIGPAGDIILSDSVRKWTNSGLADKSRLSELIEIIGNELGILAEEWLVALQKKHCQIKK